MRQLTRLLIVSSLLAVAMFVGPSAERAQAQAAGSNSILGAPRVSPQAMTSWFSGATRQAYRASVSLDELTRLYVEEGIRYNVRGDVAFAQAILETGWFSYPDNGQVRPSDNNFAGIGACNSCSTGYNFPSARAGVRAHIQHLRNYADSTSRSWNIPDPPLLRGFDTFFLKGRAPNWEDLNGKWAVPGTTYGQTILSIYGRLLTASSVVSYCPAKPVVGLAVPPNTNAYRIVVNDGAVFAMGGASFHGGANGYSLRNQVVTTESTPSGNGYWQVSADGGVFTFGDAPFLGGANNPPLSQLVVDMASTPSGRGYWLVTADGAVFAFGDAGYFGGANGFRLRNAVVSMSATASGRGYWISTADGGIFTFGDAEFMGGANNPPLNQLVTSIQMTKSGWGYWLVTADGAVFTFGDAPYLGAANGLRFPARFVGMARTASGNGYWLVAGDGVILNYGDAPIIGSLGSCVR